MTLKQKYEKMNHKKAITDKMVFKLDGCSSGRYLRKMINEENVKEEHLKELHKVFDRQIAWQENEEKKHYLNLLK